METVNLPAFLQEASSHRVSDVYLTSGSPITLSMEGRTVHVGEPLTDADTERLAHELYRLAARENAERVFATGDDSFSFLLPGVSRFRVNLLRQRGSFAAILRLTPLEIPSPAELNIPDEVMELCDIENGLVLVTGLNGCGKTTTLACMLDRINRTRCGKLIVTLENPLEYVHRSENCIMMQRELYSDTASREDALRAVKYQRAHVLMLSDLPGPGIAQDALSVAQSGVLVLTAFHGTSAADALQNLLDLFVGDRKTAFCAQLSATLKAVVFQRLVPALDGTPLPAFEVVRIGEALRHLLAEGNISSLSEVISASRTRAVIPFDSSLANLFRAKRISYDTAVQYAQNKDRIRRQLY